MNLVQTSLRRPYTVMVAVIAVALGGVMGLRQMPRDIFPTLGIPTIYVAQPYGGMDPAQMEGYLTYYYEYHFLYIIGIEHVESKSIQGAAIIKLQFYPGTDMAAAMAETVAYVNRARAFMPPGTVPPFITRFDAGSVPVGNLVFNTDNPNRTVGEMQDAALNLVRPLFATLPGVSAPPPFGGSARSIVVNVKPDRLRAYNMSPDEIVASLTAANTISPSGNMSIGNRYPMVPLNSVVKSIKDLESVPIRAGVYPAVFLRDVGTVQDASDIVTCFALVNGRRTVYIPVTKRADASTLSVVNRVKENLPKFQSVLPPDVQVTYEFDQSPYVRRAIGALTMEGALGALLTGLVIWLFLRDWRSALLVVLNIPLALLGAALALWITRQTVNIMTLGGLALAIGILVDMSMVAIENIHTHRAQGKAMARSVVDSGKEVALPLLVAMFCVLAVFVPSFFMEGAARAMFIPLSAAVGFSMVASYLLASTFVPVIAIWIIRAHPTPEMARATPGGLSFERFQTAYQRAMQRIVRRRWPVAGAYVAAVGLVIVFVGSRLGTEIFPHVEAGQLQLRLRAPAGTHVTGTEAIALQALDIIKQEAGAPNIAITLGFVGVHAPSYPINLIYLWNGGSEEGVLQVQLKPGAPVRIEDLKERLRLRFAEELPDVMVSFEPSDIVSRVMSLGAATPIEVTVSGPNLAANREFAEKVKERLHRIPSLRDVQFGQALDYPTVDVAVNRERAGLMGVKMSEVSRSLVAATSSSRFVVPNYWADPNSGVAYQIQVQIPQTNMNSVEAAQNLPVSFRDGKAILLRNVASVREGTAVGQYERYNMQRMISVTANMAEADLGMVKKQVTKALQEVGAPPPKVNVALRGQIVPMQQMFDGLQTGLLLAVVVIFLLLLANFQSIMLAVIVVCTLPAVIAGVVLTLWLTHTTLNIQSFMGAIMAVGVALANAILLVTFAERSRMAGAAPALSAVEGAQSRLRPILMTSLAMIAGLIPMALGLGEGGEQTAPLGRAVVGGLLGGTTATLLVLPSVFAIGRGRAGTRSASLDPDDSFSGQDVAPVGHE
ncbi:MAG TPA: efflux RND transporter permease subunit [Verrucomicrobiae bacterium]|nr:efflux RND transporter permease subunit [Verrucomicrobiae bacterium]